MKLAEKESMAYTMEPREVEWILVKDEMEGDGIGTSCNECCPLYMHDWALSIAKNNYLCSFV